MLETLFIDIPEAFLICSISNALLGKRLSFERISKLTALFILVGYLVKYQISTEVNVIILFFVYNILLYMYIKEEKIKCLISSIISYSIKFISEFITFMILNFMNIDIDKVLNNTYSKIVLIDITLIITWIIFSIISKKDINIINLKINKPKIFLQSKFMTKLLILLSIINILIVQTVAVAIISNLDIYKPYNRYNFIIIGVIIWIVFCVVCLIITVLILEKNKDSVQIENNLIRNNLNQMKETVDLLRIQRHDYMNHLQVILMQVSNGKNEDAKKYILGISDDIKNNTSVFDTGSNYIDAILNFKSAKCSEYNIQLTACIDSLLENTPLKDTQLGSIFLNIIDNAIDELKKYEKEYKYIHVDTYTENDKHYISINNNGRKIDDTKKIFEMGFSSKGNNRGYGLYSIKQLLQSKKCNIEVCSDDEITEFIIELPVVNKSLYKV